MLISIILSATSARSGWICANSVSWNDYLEVAHVSVQGGVQDALLGDLAGKDQPLDSVLAEEVLELGLAERRMARLDHEWQVIRRQDRLD